MKRGAPGPAGCLPPARSSTALHCSLYCWCSWCFTALCTALCTADYAPVCSCAALWLHSATARHRTSPPPSLSGCAPVVGPRARGKHFGASFALVDLLAGGFAPVPGEEETVTRKGEGGGGGKEKKRRGGREIGVWSEQRNRCNGRGLLCCSESGGRGKCEGGGGGTSTPVRVMRISLM